ncbi:MerC domain-containing protein [Flavivirga algicola]|uniref:MerC domain-containing protein n=1 Tax=Flavivirga algicola TaxID=2729136 RepID=A0ABX1RTL4_9FLAO|nr:MerC domain-containing protein [Flavivirga algicola]NMH86894.1 MerC domain-containing protein [Flavivirga algicola]
MRLITKKPDTLGAIASTLCMVHCIATPLLFIAHTCAEHGCSTTPTWWKSLDYFFLFISFFAVYRSTKTTSKNFMKPLLWLSWSALFLVILNEMLGIYHVPEGLTYTPALALVALHLYNLKYCQCKTENCCINHG